MIERWVIVGGCPRSGTTLVGNALGAGEGVIVTPEAQFAGAAFAALEAGTLAPSADEIIAFVTNHWRYQIWKDPVPQDWPSFAACKDGTALCRRVICHIVGEHARHQGRPEARVWIDHTPEHLRAVNRLSKVGLDLCAVHLIRDGRGVAASMQNVDWGPQDIASLAHWWQGRLAEGFAAQQQLAANSSHVHYEEILRDPQTAFERLCQALDIDYTPEMLTSQALKVIEYTRTQHTAVGLRPDPEKATAWKASLSSRNQEIFEAIAGHTLSLLGYDCDFTNPRPQTRAEALGAFLRYNPLRRRLVKRAHRARRAASVPSS